MSANTYRQRDISSENIPNWEIDAMTEADHKPPRHLKSVTLSSLNKAATEEPATSAADSSQTSGHSTRIVRNSLFVVILLLVAAGIFKLQNVKQLADDVTDKGKGMFSSAKDILLKKKTNTLAKNGSPANQSEHRTKGEPKNNYKIKTDSKKQKSHTKTSYKKKSRGHITAASLDTSPEDLKDELKNSFKQGSWQ